jgi:glycosyltransferase involved in cell wall biosynthesis
VEILVNQSHVRVFAVIVLYKMQPSDSPAFRTLQAAISGLNGGQADIGIVLYDNTPGGQDAGMLPSGVQYKADVENGGLAKAYNYALEIAQAEGFDWLLTLDQDTSLPGDFLCKLCHTLSFVEPLDTVAAIVPLVSSGRQVVSPSDRRFLRRRQRFPDGFIGIPSGTVYAINSASTIRVSALDTIGGYDPKFPIWASDLVMYRCLSSNNFRVFVAGNIYVEIESSALDLKNRSTPVRFKDMLQADEAFYDKYLGNLEHIILLLLMFHRLWTTRGNLPYFKIAFRYFCRSLFYSRKHRMESRKQS